MTLEIRWSTLLSFMNQLLSLYSALTLGYTKFHCSKNVILRAMINRDWPDTPLRRWYESHEVILQKDLETQEGIREQAQKKR